MQDDFFSVSAGDKTQPLTIIHICDKEFEMLQPLTTSDTHVFFNVNGWQGPLDVSAQVV